MVFKLQCTCCFCTFVLSQVHQHSREDNPNIYYWAETRSFFYLFLVDSKYTFTRKEREAVIVNRTGGTGVIQSVRIFDLTNIQHNHSAPIHVFSHFKFGTRHLSACCFCRYTFISRVYFLQEERSQLAAKYKSFHDSFHCFMTLSTMPPISKLPLTN